MMKLTTKYKFKPALLVGFLTPLYDFFGGINRRKKFHERVFSNIRFGDKWRILDVGCGTGEDLALIRSDYLDTKLYGIDADPRIIDAAKRKNEEGCLNINFSVALAEELPFKNEFFDAVLCVLTLHHLPTEYKKQALKEMFRVLKPDGKCFLVVFSRPENSVLARLISIQNLLEHTRDNYQNKIPQFVREAGFRNVEETKVFPHVSVVEAQK